MDEYENRQNKWLNGHKANTITILNNKDYSDKLHDFVRTENFTFLKSSIVRHNWKKTY